MIINIQTISAVLSLAFGLVVLNLVRRNKLKEQYALLWLLFVFINIITVWQIGNLNPVAHLLGIVSPPNLLFLLGIGFCFVLILHLTVVVSRLEERVIRLTQELAIMKQKNKQSM